MFGLTPTTPNVAHGHTTSTEGCSKSCGRGLPRFCSVAFGLNSLLQASYPTNWECRTTYWRHFSTGHTVN